MSIPTFKIEEYFAKYEFSAPYLLSPSDSEPYTMPELLALASPERMEQWNNLWLGYTEAPGHPELLAGIAALYDGLDTQNVLGIIPEEGIFIAMQTLVEAGDHVISTFPSYQSLYEIARSKGADMSFWQPRREDGWSFSVDDLEQLITPKTKLIVMNFPHNPTGALLTKDEYQRVIELAKQHNAYVFSDEIYRYFEFDEADRLPSGCELYENVVTLGGLSKSFGLPGLRVGWLATQNTDLIQRFVNYKYYTTICGSAPSEILGLIAIDNMAQLAQRNKAIAQENLALLEQFFATHSDTFWWSRPKAGTVTLAELTMDTPIAEFAEQAVASHGVMIVPNTIFDYDGNYFRLGFGRRNLPQVLEQLEAFLGS